jgi:hypothetical protein
MRSQFYKELDIVTWKSCRMWNVHGEWHENFKDLEIMQNLQLKYYLKVIFCEYGQSLGKSVVNWFLLSELKHH